METTQIKTPVLYFYFKDANMSFFLINGFKENGRFISRCAAMQIELNTNIIFLN